MDLFMILEEARQGNLSCISQDAVMLINNAALDIIFKDSKNMLTPADIDVLMALIEISNILYNNTTMDILPLDDGIYDMLMIIAKNRTKNYPVGARPVSFENNTDEGTFRVNPFIFEDPGLRSNMFGNLFMNFKWQYHEASPLPENGSMSKKTRDTAHGYPELVGTLDKCKFVLTNDAILKGMANASNVEILERDFFGKHIQMGLYGPQTQITVIAELKYDGISVEADVSNRILGARTRGDTNHNKATDLTDSLGGYMFPNANKVKDEEAFGIKFEAIISYNALYDLNMTYNKGYKNARNAVTGLITGKDGYRWRDYITMVPLATSIAQKMNLNRAQEIEFLNTYYFNRQDKLVYQVMTGNYIQVLYQIKEFMRAAEMARKSMPFAYDGIVISYMDPYIIRALGRDNSVNKYQMAVKFETMVKDTVFLGYQYTVGQNGVITPMIYYKPIEFFGCIHNKSTGHSYARFKDLDLSYGDIITVEYVNDVMPYVIGKADPNAINPNPPIEFPTVCPSCGTPLRFSEKSATCFNPSCPEKCVARLTNMLQKLRIDGFSESAVRTLGLRSFSDLISIPNEVIDERFGKGKLADNFKAQRGKLLTNHYCDYQLVGALGFDGIAEGLWRTILRSVSLKTIIVEQDTNKLYNKLVAVSGIGSEIASTIVSQRSLFLNDLILINNMPNVSSTLGSNTASQVRFSGVRDKELQTYLESLGIDCTEGSVTRRTMILIVPHAGYKSSKTAKAAPYCLVVPIDEFKQNMDYYVAKLKGAIL